MIKKILIIIIGVASLLLATPKTYAKTNMLLDLKDEKIAIEIIKDSNTITINHTSGKILTHAIVEYAFMENGKKISMLATYEVNNNKFEVNSNVYALKVHQVKTLVNRVYYRYATTNKNSIGDFIGVERQNIVEIETTAVNTIKSLEESSFMVAHRIYEFYFNFDKKHDELLSIDVDYVVYKKRFGAFEYGYENATERTLTYGKNYTIKHYLYSTKPPEYYKQLEANNNSSFPGNYVARVAPTAVESNSNLSDISSVYYVENFAIVRIRYKVDGEFIIDDVNNDPTSPEEDINWLLALINKIKKALNEFSTLWSRYSKYFIIGIIAFFALLIWGPVSTILKLLWFIIKLPFIALKRLGKLIKWLFIPKKKGKYQYQKYGGKEK